MRRARDMEITTIIKLLRNYLTKQDESAAELVRWKTRMDSNKGEN